jgi:hypothetical protein
MKMDKILVLHPMIQGVEKYRKFFVDQTDVEVQGLSEGPGIIRNRADQALLADQRKLSKRRRLIWAIVLTPWRP